MVRGVQMIVQHYSVKLGERFEVVWPNIQCQV